MLKKRLGKKGFTLVEIIVVLVILAILAAILIPSMVGWIDKANEKSAVVAGRSILLAAQTITSEAYAENEIADTGVLTEAQRAEVVELVALDPAPDVTSVTVGDNAQVTNFTATWNNRTITYDGAFTVSD